MFIFCLNQRCSMCGRFIAGDTCPDCDDCSY